MLNIVLFLTSDRVGICRSRPLSELPTIVPARKLRAWSRCPVVVPAADVALFNQFAAQRRNKHLEDRHPAGAPNAVATYIAGIRTWLE
ncbi:hypothetical protein OKW42_000130 [Paraburkholderia sp. WC7.3d]